MEGNTMENNKYFTRTMLGVFLCMCLGLTLIVFCSCQKKNYSQDGVAAKLDEDTLYEADVNEYIKNMRIAYNCTSDNDWREYLKKNNLDIQGVRNYVIKYLFENYRTFKLAKQYNLTINDADLNIAASLFPEIKDVVYIINSFDEKDASAWSNRFVPDYKTLVAYEAYFTILKSKVALYISSNVMPKNSNLDDFMNKNSGKLNGKKGYQVMYFDSSKNNEANQALAKIKTDPTMFERVVAMYSIKYADNFPENLFVMYNLEDYVQQSGLSEFFNSVSNLEVGQVSDVIDYNGKYKVIVKCIDKIDDPKNVTEYSSLPEKSLTYLNAFLNDVVYSEDFQNDLRKSSEDSTLEIFDIESKDLPYNIDL
jgi:hypothetical protein